MHTVQTAGAVSQTGRAVVSRSVRPDSGWLAWYEAQRAAVNAALSTHLKALKAANLPHTRVLDAVEYALLQPGKRLRPILVLEACRACGGAESAAWPVALAVECIHTFSLIHDDLPAMDDDDLRRGAPTCHKVFGEALAILAGDWLVAHAFELAASSPGERRRIPPMVAALARGTQAMVVGQGADIEGEQMPTDAERVRFIHRHKTAALLESCVIIGAHAAYARLSAVDALAQFGRHLGVEFQICDDILDETASTADLGKRARKDARASKQTYPAAFGLDESRRQATSEIDAATAALEPFCDAASNLRGLAKYVIERNS
jgi:geranylgeranyl diphosphate synthase type II